MAVELGDAGALGEQDRHCPPERRRGEQRDQALDDRVQIAAGGAGVGRGGVRFGEAARRRHHEVDLARVAAVDRGLADPGTRGDAFHGEPVEATLREEVDRGLENRLVGLGAAGRPRRRASASVVAVTSASYRYRPPPASGVERPREAGQTLPASALGFLGADVLFTSTSGQPHHCDDGTHQRRTRADEDADLQPVHERTLGGGRQGPVWTGGRRGQRRTE